MVEIGDADFPHILHDCGQTILYSHLQNVEEKRMVRTRVEICGIDTSELPLLTNDVMKETFIRLQSGDHCSKGRACHWQFTSRP